MKNASENPSPQLRFKGFEDSWQIVKGGELFENRREKGKEDLPIYSVSIDQGLVPRSSIEKHMKNDADAEKNCAVKPGDISYNTMRMWQGAMGVSDLECMVSPAYIVLAPHKDILSGFYFYLFKSNKYLHALKSYSYGLTSDRLRLYYKDFAVISFPTCDLSEQQKVVKFLTVIDKKISLLKQKHSLLLQYKKGVMQQLFSQKIRFKDDNGKGFPDWQVFQLQDIATPIKRKAVKAIDNVMTISAGRGFLHQADRFSQIIAGTSLDKYTLLRKNEFAYNRGNSKRYTYGCIYKLEDHDEALVPFVYRSFSLDKGVPAFYEHLFEHKYLDRQLRRLISSSARMDGLLNIGEKAFYKVKLPFPCEKEQIRIAEFVSALNEKIELAAKQIELTQTFKKGLLQQMFV